MSLLKPTKRTLYALVAEDGRVLSRVGRWSDELRTAELRARVREWDVLRRSFGGTVHRVQLTLVGPAYDPPAQIPEGRA